jgi:Holliday junction resolvase RusA-like endonuclease
MAILYQALIPLNPKTKKNSQQIITNRKTGRAMIIQSSEYKQYEHDVGFFLKKIPQPIDKPVNVKCIFYRKNAIRCDQSNLIAAIDDILVKYGILADDNFKVIAGHDGSRVYIDKENPRTEITIETVENQEV